MWSACALYDLGRSLGLHPCLAARRPKAMRDRVFQPLLSGLHGEPKPAAFTYLRLFQVLGRPLPGRLGLQQPWGSSSPLGISGGSVIENQRRGSLQAVRCSRCRQKLGHEVAFAVNREHLGLPNNADGRELVHSLIGDGRDDGFLTRGHPLKTSSTSAGNTLNPPTMSICIAFIRPMM
jgi:hypothetical protein